jgi:hypothetical protein
VQDQIGHFNRKYREASKPHRFFTWLTHRSAVAALVFVLLACVCKIYDASFGKPFLKEHAYLSAFLHLFLPFLMPLLATVGASFGIIFDYSRRITRYHQMEESLEQVKRVLPVLKTLPDITQLVRHTEESLQDENIEWFYSQKKDLEH